MGKLLLKSIGIEMSSVIKMGKCINGSIKKKKKKKDWVHEIYFNWQGHVLELKT